jgi:putative membrane protein
MTRGQLWLLGAFGALVAVTWIRPPWPAEQALHSSLTAVAIVALWLLRRRLDTAQWAWALVFLALHTIAARWIYSFVPYDDWTNALFSMRLSEAFSWERNHFDRLVHFAYGVCLTAVLRRKWLRSLEIVLATSALYELLEWAIALTLAPDVAEAYNGQQGDMWDAHADMALAALGALVTSLASCARRRSPAAATRSPAPAAAPRERPGRAPVR